MSIAQKANKENFRLLDLSSDEQSEDLQLEIIPSRKKKITRRERSRNSAPQSPNPNVGSEVRCALLWAVRGTLVLWLLMLTWICASLYDQVSTMHTDMFKVSTSSNSFDDALQVCHTAARELRANATKLGDRLEKLELDYQKLVKRVEKANEEFAALSGAAPELAETPRKLHTLEITVGNIGSQIAGIDNDVKTSHQHVSETLAGMQDVKSLLQRLEVKSNETVANISASLTRETELDRKITLLNATLAEKVGTLEKRIIELSKPATLAPSTMSTTIKSVNSTITSSNTTTSTTPLPTQGSPSKPNVLHTEGTN